MMNRKEPKCCKCIPLGTGIVLIGIYELIYLLATIAYAALGFYKMHM